jgi:hypothetical protein
LLMVFSVFANNKVVVYQLLGNILRRRPGHQQRVSWQRILARKTCGAGVSGILPRVRPSPSPQ